MKEILLSLSMVLVLGSRASADSAVTAKSEVTIKCEVKTMGEYSQTKVHSVSFDPDKKDKPLNFSVYGLHVVVHGTFTMSEDEKWCGHEISGVCVENKAGIFCSNTPTASVVPTGRYSQAGDRAEISCSLIGGEAKPCSKIDEENLDTE